MQNQAWTSIGVLFDSVSFSASINPCAAVKVIRSSIKIKVENTRFKWKLLDLYENDKKREIPVENASNILISKIPILLKKYWNSV